jgi:hypothetical protein
MEAPSSCQFQLQQKHVPQDVLIVLMGYLMAQTQPAQLHILENVVLEVQRVINSRVRFAKMAVAFHHINISCQ